MLYTHVINEYKHMILSCKPGKPDSRIQQEKGLGERGPRAAPGKMGRMVHQAGSISEG